MMKKFADLESQLKASSAPRSGLTLQRLQEEISEFKTHVWSILNLLRQQISEIARSVEVSEMRHRRKYLLVSGIPEDIEELPVYVAKLFNSKLGVPDISCDKLNICHRLGILSEGKCRPVLVRFSEYSDKSSVWKKKTAFKGTSYVVSEFLTRRRQSLFLQARQHFGMKNCWTADGIIMVKLSDGSRHRIFEEEDLKGIIASASDLRDAQVQPGTRSPSPAPAVDQHLKSKRAARCKK